MRNFRYSDPQHTTIQAEDDQGNTLNIPVADGNRHYREVLALVEKGGASIAPYAPDPAAVAGARQAKVAARMLTALADDANAGKTLDQLRVEAKAAVEAPAAEIKPQGGR